MADEITVMEPEVILVEPTDKALAHRERQELSLPAFRKMEDELLEESASIVRDALYFGDVEFEVDSEGNPIPPDELLDKWTEELGGGRKGRALAKKRLRLAKYALMPNKEAPYGLKLAQAVMNGIQRVRMADKIVQHDLNIGHVVIVQNQYNYPEREVEGNK